MGRIPFELAEPGTDPTRHKNPRPKKDWTDALPWMFGLVGMLIIGYLLFGEQLGLKTAQSAPETSRETSAVTETVKEQDLSTPALSKSLSERETVTETVETTPTATVSSTESLSETLEVKITAEGVRLVCYEVGEVECWCYKDGRPPGGDDVALCQVHEPEVCR